MSANSTVQPPTQPQPAPIARLIHENVVPQSGSASFMCLYAQAMQIIGMNETMITAGMWVPIPAITTMNPIVAARL